MVELFRMAELHGVCHPKYLPEDLTYGDVLDWREYQRMYGYRDDILWGKLTAAMTGETVIDEMPYLDVDLIDLLKEEFGESMAEFRRLKDIDNACQTSQT